MSILKNSLLISILIILVSFSMCFAIDENQFSQTTQTENTYSNVDTTNALATNESNQNTYENQSIENNIATNTFDDSQTTQLDSVQPSTTVSSVSSTQNISTIGNILNIVLIVVGVLLIFLAIAILIRLH